MSSAFIRCRYTKSGPRWQVLYRIGGRESKITTYGTYRSEAAAEAARDQVRDDLAACKPMRPHMARDAYAPRLKLVYFARFGSHIKIGIAIDPVARCRDLNADLLFTEPGGRAREQDLHKRFAVYHYRGEWFDDAGELAVYVRKAGAAMT